MRQPAPERRTARIVLINDKNQILLLKIEDKTVSDLKDAPVKSRWITIGGKIESGETPEVAAARELKEETGIVAPIGKCIWYGEHRLNWKGVETLLKESFFYVRVKNSNFSSDGMLQDEKAVFKAHKWWTVDEILATNEMILPKDLGDLLKPIIAGKIPEQTLTIDLSTPAPKETEVVHSSIFRCGLL